MDKYSTIVVGAGIVGAAVAFGLVRKTSRVLVLDGNDIDYRASRANFGLISQQGKGLGMPAYQQLTRQSVERWSDFNRQLSALSGIDPHFEQAGGLSFCLDETEFRKRDFVAQQLCKQSGGSPDFEMLDRADLVRLLPDTPLGLDVYGACLGLREGHVNPMRLLLALQQAILRRGGELRSGDAVNTIRPVRHGFVVETARDRFGADSVLIAAGIGTTALAAQVELDIPLTPQRGQILVTERLKRVLPLPASGLRQTREGSITIGFTEEDVGQDLGTTVEAAAVMSRRATRILPMLRHANLVRQWAGLRVLTPDGYPIYAQSQRYRGAFALACHSGITLAAFHAGELASAINAGDLPNTLAPFHPRRFDVQKN